MCNGRLLQIYFHASRLLRVGQHVCKMVNQRSQYGSEKCSAFPVSPTLNWAKFLGCMGLAWKPQSRNLSEHCSALTQTCKAIFRWSAPITFFVHVQLHVSIILVAAIRVCIVIVGSIRRRHHHHPSRIAFRESFSRFRR